MYIDTIGTVDRVTALNNAIRELIQYGTHTARSSSKTLLSKLKVQL